MMYNFRALMGLFAVAAVITVATGAVGEDGFALKESSGEHLDVVLDGKTIARFMIAYDPARREETYKPYLHVMDADGKAPITKDAPTRPSFASIRSQRFSHQSMKRARRSPAL